MTALATEKLKEVIQAQTTDPEVAIGLLPSLSMLNRLEMALNRESEGVKILFISPELAPALEGMTIDCQETPQGVSFSISKPAPGT